LHGEHALIDAVYYGDNLAGSNSGHTWALHGAWVPINLPREVVHLALAGSMEYSEGRTDETGMPGLPTVSLNASPSILLKVLSLKSSGALEHVKSIERTGSEGLWIRGPVAWETEYLCSYSLIQRPWSCDFNFSIKVVRHT
jgi:phosphate-selective porin OprO and OprP